MWNRCVLFFSFLPASRCDPTIIFISLHISSLHNSWRSTICLYFLSDTFIASYWSFYLILHVLSSSLSHLEMHLFLCAASVDKRSRFQTVSAILLPHAEKVRKDCSDRQWCCRCCRGNRNERIKFAYVRIKWYEKPSKFTYRLIYELVTHLLLPRSFFLSPSLPSSLSLSPSLMHFKPFVSARCHTKNRVMYFLC